MPPATPMQLMHASLLLPCRPAMSTLNESVSRCACVIVVMRFTSSRRYVICARPLALRQHRMPDSVPCGGVGCPIACHAVASDD